MAAHEQSGARAIRPAPRLVQLCAIAALCAVGAIAFAPLVAVTLAFAAAVAALALIDLRVSLRDPQPRLQRVMPERIVKGRAAEVLYRISRPEGGPTSVSILDELPDELGGDLRVEAISLGRDETREVAREVSGL